MDPSAIEALEQQFREGRSLAPEFLQAARRRQREHQAAQQARLLAAERISPGRLGRKRATTPRLPNLRNLSELRRPRHADGYRFPSGDMMEPLDCYPGYFQLAADGSSYQWGSDPEPRLGPVVNPPPEGFEDGPILHAFSIWTPNDTSAISIAGAAAVLNDPHVTVNGLHGFEGYETTHQPEDDAGTIGWTLSASSSQMFTLPDLPNREILNMQARARLTNDHPLEDLIVSYMRPAGDADPNNTISGIMTLTVYQGLGALFGGPEPKAFSWAKLAEFQQDRIYGNYEPGSYFVPTGGGPVYRDIEVFFPYDGQSTVIVVEVGLHFWLHIAPDGGSPCFVAMDARLVDDDRTMVIPDGVTAADVEANPMLASKSCPFVVSDVTLCGFNGRPPPWVTTIRF